MEDAGQGLDQETDQEPGGVAGQQTALLKRATTAPVLTPVNSFWHGACMGRVCQILGLYLLLSFCGTFIYATISPVLGAAALAMGPSAIIMWIFYKRFQCSTTKLQAWYTFLEAIGWMLVLFIVIEFVDKWNKDANGVDVVLHCEMEAAKGGKAFVGALSFAAHCFHAGNGTAALAPPPPSGDWDGLNCTKMPNGLANLSLILPEKGEGPDRKMPLPALLVYQIASDAAKNTFGTVCPAIEKHVPDALSPVLFESLTYNGVSAQSDRRLGLRSAFDKLFGRWADGSNWDTCPCIKEYREPSPLNSTNATVPFYDFCEADRCNISRNASCAWSGKEAPCSPVKEDGNVEATLSFRKKTVAYAFVEAYFRAGFLEELLKYVAVRRILFKDRVVDCGGLIVYGLAAAAGFATAENVQYTLMHGVFVTYLRMVCSIPLHCCTGMMIGIHLGYRKFLGQGITCLDKFLLAMSMPVFIHGTYDFVLMLPQSLSPGQGVRMLISMGIMVLGFVICRCMWLKIENVCVVHVKDLQRDGRVSKSTCCCCERDCCCGVCVQEDPLLKQQAQVQVDDRCSESSKSSAASTRTENVLRLTKSFSSQLLPEAPTCQTREDTCPNCGNTVRVHVLFPSDCPFCGHSFPDPAPPSQHQP